MPQVDFFFCRQDKMQLADFIFKSGAHMVLEDNYSSQDYTSISTLEEYKKNIIDNNVLMFVINDEFMMHPLEWDTFEKEGTSKFFIRQKHGGPTIDFYSPGMIELEKRIGPGFLAAHSFYYSGCNKFLPNEKYKALFKAFSSFIKKNSKPVKLQKRTYWIGNNTISLCKKEGYSLIEVAGKNLVNMIQ